MNKHIKLIGIVIMIYVLFLVPCTSYGEAGGFIDVKVSAPEEFEHSIMINLLDKDNVNYVVVAEPVNDWKANTSLPVGEYTVDYVSFEKADTEFELEYPKSLSIKANAGTAFSVSVNKKDSKMEQQDQSKKMYVESGTEDEKQKLSFVGRLGMLAGNIFKKNCISILIIIAILIFLYRNKKKKERFTS